MIRVPVGDLSAEDALAALEAADHRVTVVPTIEELIEDSELKGYDTFGTVEQPGLGTLMALGLPIQWSEASPPRGGRPRLWEPTQGRWRTEVCGFSDSEVARLDEEGALE